MVLLFILLWRRLTPSLVHLRVSKHVDIANVFTTNKFNLISVIEYRQYETKTYLRRKRMQRNNSIVETLRVLYQKKIIPSHVNWWCDAYVVAGLGTFQGQIQRRCGQTGPPHMENPSTVCSEQKQRLWRAGGQKPAGHLRTLQSLQNHPRGGQKRQAHQ